ncbi:hypothetical protein [Streptomyces iakyrus]|uniref:hypothetical protein n=1 Tax=Streptomyces iakyrus TaxID=68219 RepID=UPI0036CE84B6
MTHTVPNTPAAFVERMLRDGIRADQLAAEHINDRDLREPNINTAVAAYIAANAIHTLARHNQAAADLLADNLHRVIAAGDLTGPLRRAATALEHDADRWVADFKEQLARRQPMPPAGTATTHAALTTLAERWEQMAANEGKALQFLEGPNAEWVADTARERIRTYAKAAADIRNVLATGRIPHDLMTDAELEQHGTPEENAS